MGDDDSGSLALPLPPPMPNDELDDDDGLAISGEPSVDDDDDDEDECGLLRRRRESCEHCSGDENESCSRSIPPCAGRADDDEMDDRRAALDGARGKDARGGVCVSSAVVDTEAEADAAVADVRPAGGDDELKMPSW
jgi:hypothetical protein